MPPELDDVMSAWIARLEYKVDQHIASAGHPGHDMVHSDIVHRLDDICANQERQQATFLNFTGNAVKMGLGLALTVIMLLLSVAGGLAALALHLKP